MRERFEPTERYRIWDPASRTGYSIFDQQERSSRSQEARDLDQALLLISDEMEGIRHEGPVQEREFEQLGNVGLKEPDPGA